MKFSFLHWGVLSLASIAVFTVAFPVSATEGDRRSSIWSERLQSYYERTGTRSIRSDHRMYRPDAHHEEEQQQDDHTTSDHDMNDEHTHDDHDSHSDNDSHNENHDDMHGDDGHNDSHGHGEPLEAAEPIPSIDLIVHKDPRAGYNLEIVTENYTLTPQNASTEHVDGEGHLHLFINGERITRVYGNWFYLADFDELGEYEIRVELSANDHRVYAHEGELIDDTEVIVVE